MLVDKQKLPQLCADILYRLDNSPKESDDDDDMCVCARERERGMVLSARLNDNYHEQYARTTNCECNFCDSHMVAQFYLAV